MRWFNRAGLTAALLAAGVAAAETPADLQHGYEAAARTESPAFGGFSARRGEAFFSSTHANSWSCASCHTRNPLGRGQHVVTGRPIAPLAPAENAARFTDQAKAEKWFTRNCKDVLRRVCTATEKGDVLAYLLSLNK